MLFASFHNPPTDSLTHASVYAWLALLHVCDPDSSFSFRSLPIIDARINAAAGQLH
jgi:hypothetical protein